MIISYPLPILFSSHGLIHRLFQKVYSWDYVEKVFAWFNQYFRNGESKKLTQEQRYRIFKAKKWFKFA
jgi:hypothetical protein